MHWPSYRRLRVVNRESWVLDICRGTTVLHIGFADYPYYAEQWQAGHLLHPTLVRVAKEVWGVDTCPERAFDFFRARGFNNLLCGNAEALSDLKLEKRFSVVVAGEVLEHLANPGLFFLGVKDLLDPGGRVVVTVPNAHSIKGFIRACIRRELVHEDHVSYYSLSTLRELGRRYGFEIEDCGAYLAPPSRLLGRIASPLLSPIVRLISPYVADGFVSVFRLRSVDVCS